MHIIRILKLKNVSPVAKNIKLDTVINVRAIDPIDPERVFFGLILVNFGPWINFPKIYPPRSDAIHPASIMNIKTFSWKKLVKKN